MSRFSAESGGDKQIMYWEYEGYDRPFLECMGMYLIYIYVCTSMYTDTSLHDPPGP